MSQSGVGQLLVRGVITGIEGGVARVLVGDVEDEWFIPESMIGASAAVDDCVWLIATEGGYAVHETTRDRPSPGVRGFGERLDRLRADKRGLASLQPVQSSVIIDG